MHHRHLVLASQSPRRRQILTISGFDFEVLPSQISEIPDENLNLREKIRQLAADKAKACLKMRNGTKGLNFLVLAADTVVVLDDQILGKPKDEAEARSFLRRLSGRSHLVLTAVTMVDSSTLIEFSGHAETTVKFRDLSPDEIDLYVKTGEPFDKAGGYGIQGLAAQFIQDIQGPYDNVVGLPMDVVNQGVIFFQEKVPGFHLSRNPRMDFIKERLRKFKSNIAELSAKSARGSIQTKLIAVSKTKPSTDVVFAWRAGQVDFGENYAQEAIQKKRDVEMLICSMKPGLSELRWHFIGHLQTKKVKQVVGEFDLIHSVDRLSLAEEISKRAVEKSIIQSILLQVNFADEKTKSGVATADYVELALKISQMPGISLCGLMALPPLFESHQETSALFREIIKLFEITRSALEARSITSFTEISLGTTQDYQEAILSGATMVRIGTAIFGERA
jgi:MAF protein